MVPNPTTAELRLPDDQREQRQLHYTNDQLAPSKLTIGGRFLPWKLHGTSITAAFDIGVTGQNDFIAEVTPIPPWTLYIGAGWTVDTWDRPPVVETKIVEKGTAPPPPLGHIKGYVDEAGKPEVGVPNAIVAFVNPRTRRSRRPLASSADDRLPTLGLPPGKYDLAVKADGYKDGTCTATLADRSPPPPRPPRPPAHRARRHQGSSRRGGRLRPSRAGCAPTPRSPARSKRSRASARSPVALRGLPRTPRNGVAAATPKLHRRLGATAGVQRQTSDGQGNFRFDGLAPVGYQITASGDLYMNDVESVDVKPRQDAEVNVILMKRPKVALVAVTQKEITIRQQVQFATDSAVILPASAPVFSRRSPTLSICNTPDPQGGDPGPHRQQRRRRAQPGSQRRPRKRRPHKRSSSHNA